MCGQSLSRKQIVLQRGHGLENTIKGCITAAKATRSTDSALLLYENNTWNSARRQDLYGRQLRARKLVNTRSSCWRVLRERLVTW
jgi:hypothetical protein